MSAILKRIVLENVKSIEFLDIEVGPVVVITGDNGVGKSSILDALKDIFEGGHYPGLIRDGAQFARTTLYVEDEDGEWKITKKQEPSGYDLDVRRPDGSGRIRREKEFVEQLAAGFALDPLELLTAEPKDVNNYFLKILDIKFTADELNKAFGQTAPTPFTKSMSLKELETLLSGQEATRTDINRKIRDLLGNQRTLQDTLPKGEKEQPDYAALLDKIQTDRREVSAQIAKVESEAKRLLAEEIAGIESEARTAIAEHTSECNALVQEFRNEIAALEIKIRSAEADRAEKEAKVTQSKAARIAQAKAEMSGALDAQTEMLRANASALDVQIATTNQAKEQYDRANGVRSMIAKYENEKAPLQIRANQLDAVINNLRALRLGKLASLPIKGVSINNNELYVDGIAWPDVNTAKQISIAIQAGELTKGRMPLIVTDNMEHLTPESFEEALQDLKNRGLQVIAARVGHRDEPLTVHQKQLFEMVR